MHLFLLDFDPRELLDTVDDAIVFKPMDFNPIRQNIINSIRKIFSKIMGERISFELPEDAVEKILTGIWLGRTALEEWAEKVLAPSIQIRRVGARGCRRFADEARRERRRSSEEAEGGA
ncbi:unnamed protein product [Malus baccata var. baccata]